uniref:Uncharacterized protein n=1 Tax=Arundo donax TaxID=35708 RepID=A0A0A9C581_ARUDO
MEWKLARPACSKWASNGQMKDRFH